MSANGKTSQAHEQATDRHLRKVLDANRVELNWICANVCTLLVMTTIPLGEARARFSELVDSAEATHERITVTRHGRAVAVLLSAEDFESMVETMDVLSTPGALEEIRTSLAEFDAGRAVPWEELRAEFARAAAPDSSSSGDR